jgi:hypothetical protein
VAARAVAAASWKDARIPWRLCRPLHKYCGPSILVDEELARAVRHESAAAVRYWWGVAGTTIVAWRKALGVNRTNSPGSRRLLRASSERGGVAFRERGFSEEERERFRQQSRERARGSAPQALSQATNSATSTRRLAVSQL